jgi:hypothetical protein
MFSLVPNAAIIVLATIAALFVLPIVSVKNVTSLSFVMRNVNVTNVSLPKSVVKQTIANATIVKNLHTTVI